MNPSGRYWRVSPKFWPESSSWSDDGRLLALYLLTCPHRTTEGLFRLPKPYMVADIGWSSERLAEAMAELLGEGFIEWDEKRSLVLIVNAMKYQAPENPNQRKSAVIKLAELPRESPLTCTFKRLAEQFCEPLAKELPQGFGEPQALALPQTPTRVEEQPVHSTGAADPVDNARAALRNGSRKNVEPILKGKDAKKAKA